MLKKFAILTSGGDAPGMNTLVISFINHCFKNNVIPYIIKDGFKGLVEDNIIAVPKNNAFNVYFNKGGTFIGTSRYKEFEKIACQQQAVDNLHKHGITGLVICGGNGSYLAAKALQKYNIATIAVPGTIDNDIFVATLSLGFDTVLDTVACAIDKIRDTIESHNRCSIVVTMGRFCGDLTHKSGIITNSEIISTPEARLSEDEIVNQVKYFKSINHRSVMIVVTEHLYNVYDLQKRINDEAGFETIVNILGYAQRGGTPSATDRWYAATLAETSVHKLLANESGISLVFDNFKIKTCLL